MLAIVVSQEISEDLGRAWIVEASQADAIVVGDEGVEIGVGARLGRGSGGDERRGSAARGRGVRRGGG